MGILGDDIKRQARESAGSSALPARMPAPAQPLSHAAPAPVAAPIAAPPPAPIAAPAPGAPLPAELAAPSAPSSGQSGLSRRRDRLAEEVTELHWDLGGLAYEMAIRDHFRLDVLVRRAAILQERDAELAELERLLRMETNGTAGSCPQCGAPHSRGAVFCWQCGTGLMERLSSAT